MRTHLARFPFVKGLDAFDFTYQPSLEKKQPRRSHHFLEHGENLLILGPPGLGKTHLAVGLGLKAIEARLPGPLHDGRGDDRHPR